MHDYWEVFIYKKKKGHHPSVVGLRHSSQSYCQRSVMIHNMNLEKTVLNAFGCEGNYTVRDKVHANTYKKNGKENMSLKIFTYINTLSSLIGASLPVYKSQYKPHYIKPACLKVQPAMFQYLNWLGVVTVAWCSMNDTNITLIINIITKY